MIYVASQHTLASCNLTNGNGPLTLRLVTIARLSHPNQNCLKRGAIFRRVTVKGRL